MYYWRMFKINNKKKKKICLRSLSIYNTLKDNTKFQPTYCALLCLMFYCASVMYSLQLAVAHRLLVRLMVTHCGSLYFSISLIQTSSEFMLKIRLWGDITILPLSFPTRVVALKNIDQICIHVFTKGFFKKW